MKIDNLTPRQLAAYFDHSMLRPDNAMADYERHVAECKTYGFYSVAVNAHIVPFFVEKLAGTGIATGATAGFPFGQMSVAGKLAETKDAIASGATEVDYVLCISRLLDGDRAYIKEEMQRMTDLCHENSVVLKVILENCYLQDTHKVMACEIALETGIDFVKTSTGFGTGGATLADVKLMRSVVGDRVKVKAAGAMKDLAITADMIELGVDRIGSSFGPAIVDSFARAKAQDLLVTEYLKQNAGKPAADNSRVY